MQPLLRRLAVTAKAALNALLGAIAMLVLTLLRLTDPAWAADTSAKLIRKIGPWFPEHRIGRANLQAAFPDWPGEKIESVLGGVWENLGRVGAEFVHLDRLWPVLNPETGEMHNIDFTPETIERFVKLRDDGKPALVFAAHLANWELPALAAYAFGLHSLALYRPPAIPRLRRFIAEKRSLRMGTLVPTNLGAPTVLAEELGRGVHAGMLVDQYNSRGVDIVFFGRRTKANPLMARLARHIDCPIHGVRVVRLPNHRFRVDLTEEVAKVRDVAGEIDVPATMQAINTIIEGWVREHPEQWLWLHRRWR